MGAARVNQGIVVAAAEKAVAVATEARDMQERHGHAIDTINTQLVRHENRLATLKPIVSELAEANVGLRGCTAALVELKGDVTVLQSLRDRTTTDLVDLKVRFEHNLERFERFLEHQGYRPYDFASDDRRPSTFWTRMRWLFTGRA